MINKVLKFISVLFLLIFASHIKAETVAQIYCYLDADDFAITSYACMSGRCVDKSEQLCVLDDSSDQVELHYFNNKGNFLVKGKYPCTNSNIIKLCATYKGQAEMVSENNE